MSRPILLILASILSTLPAPVEAGPVRQVTRVAGWTVRIWSDRFSGQRSCTVTKRHISYERQALVFHLGRRIDTQAAVYRIDGGPPIAARSDQPDLIRLGFLVHDDMLDNASGGLVRIPMVRLAGARSVRIAPAPFRRPVGFDIAGLTMAQDAAGRAGCEPTAFGDRD